MIGAHGPSAVVLVGKGIQQGIEHAQLEIMQIAAYPPWKRCRATHFAAQMVMNIVNKDVLVRTS